MRIGEICTREVVQCIRTTSVADLACLMRNRHVGDVVVVEQSGTVSRPVGIVTDRDLVVKILAEGVDPDTVTAGDLMSADLATGLETEVVYDAIWQMRGKGIRRLPIVDARNTLVGVLTVDDITEFLAAELSEVARIVPHQVKLEQVKLAPVAT
jgi:CBS domain-containing protein